MKRTVFLIAITLISLSASSQMIEFRLRGGVNFQRGSSADSEFSFLPHFGASAGVRLSSIGIYGEFLYSTHDNQNWLEPGDYFVPSAIIRYYIFSSVYTEVGLSYYKLAEDPVGIAMFEFDDKKVGYFAGLGINFKRFEFGLRTTSPVASIQATASIRFSL